MLLYLRMTTMLSISLQPEYIGSVLGWPITNTFITSVVVTVLLSVTSLIFRHRHRNTLLSQGITVIVFELLKLTDAVTESRQLTKKILPLIVTFFLFIATANLITLLPGFLGSLYVITPTGKFSILRSPNSDLTTTVALALWSVLAIQFFSWQALGWRKYLGRFFNISGPVKFILGFFEIIAEGVKVLSFSFRLFGNMFAGEVLLLVIAFLLPYIIPLPFMVLEVFVGIIQAFIFMILTLTFIKTSTMKHVI